MTQIPRDPWPDSTLALAKDGYRFISKRCDRLGTELFKTRLMFKRAICMRGEEAAKVFYDTNLFKRQGAAPKLGRRTLLGEGGVQTLDGEEHRHRKRMFMSIMNPDNVRSLIQGVTDQWRAYLPVWEKRDNVELFYEANEILCRSACAWAGIPLPESDVKERTRSFMDFIDGGGSVGPRHWKGRHARTKVDQWLADLIQQVRDHKLTVPKESALEVFACGTDIHGRLLDKQTAAVELNNSVRPIVAISRYIVFGALALYEHPEYRPKFKAGDDKSMTVFIQEVRRFYPFFPMVPAIAKKDFEWKGYPFSKGDWVILDLYGTNHDPRAWIRPNYFRPERFLDWDGSPYNFVPQGGGDHYQNHRCAGEWMTIEIMKAALGILTQEMAYEVPPQDLHIRLSRLPAIPKSRMVLTKVRRKTTGDPRLARKRHAGSAH